MIPRALRASSET